jgi:hypothetical protein
MRNKRSGAGASSQTSSSRKPPGKFEEHAGEHLVAPPVLIVRLVASNRRDEREGAQLVRLLSGQQELTVSAVGLELVSRDEDLQVAQIVQARVVPGDGKRRELQIEFEARRSGPVHGVRRLGRSLSTRARAEITLKLVPVLT